MGPIEIILIVLLVAVVGAVAWAFSAYNGFIRQRNLIQESWRQVDVELNRRYELIPNLVETVRAFSAHERNTLEGIVRLRSQAQQLSSAEHGDAPSPERAQVEEQLTGAVRGLMVSVEAYPELKSNQNFLELQRQLAETEDRIAAGRRYYNANVRNYNTRIESVPSNMIASQFKFEKATYFEVNDAEVRRSPDVNFGEISYRGDAPAAGGGAGAASGQLGQSAPSELPNPQAQSQERGPVQFDQPTQQPQPAENPEGYEPPNYNR
ncbi:MAG: LemA family protein [Propionibacteriaceae bacterium]|nr:LemA family protein [Propionibacteriaceae bacterium]